MLNVMDSQGDIEQGDPVAEAWHLLRTHADELPDFWTRVYRNGLGAAFRQGDPRSGVGLAIFAALSLEHQGKPESAIAHLDDALAVFTSDRAARARLLSRRAMFEAICGTGSAAQSLAQARRGIDGLGAEDAFDLDVYTAVVRAILLEPDCVTLAERNIAAAEDAAAMTLAEGMKPWVLTAMHAFGMAERSAIWITSLGAHAEVAGDRFRRADFASLDFAARIRAQIGEPDEEALAAAPRNTIARWRVTVSRLYLGLLQRDRAKADAAIAALVDVSHRMNPAWGAGVPLYRAARDAWFEEGGDAPFPAPPAVVSAVTLPAALAGLNASSQAGSQDDAVLWRRWADERLPSHIQSSLPWPVSVDRLIALSDVRMGRPENAKRRFERAARWSEANGYPIERAITLVQLSELATLAALPTTRERWQELRRRGRAELNQLGIDPDPLAYQVARALALGRTSELTPKLTPREIEVLSLLARGHTHREVGAALGISWRTAQVHAAGAYAKLDATSRITAVSRARELGLLT